MVILEFLYRLLYFMTELFFKSIPVFRMYSPPILHNMTEFDSVSPQTRRFSVYFTLFTSITLMWYNTDQ